MAMLSERRIALTMTIRPDVAKALETEAKAANVSLSRQVENALLVYLVARANALGGKKKPAPAKKKVVRKAKKAEQEKAA